jgi:hypothetical protein
MKKRSHDLMEDIAPRGLRLDPSAGGSGDDRAPLLNVLSYLTRLSKAAAKETTQKIVRKLLTMGTEATDLIVQARNYVRQRDLECKQLRESDALFDAVWAVYDPSKSVPDAQKIALSRCLGLYSDALRKTVEIQPSEALIRQGCKELGLAAALYGYNEARSYLRGVDDQINDIIRDRYTDQLRDALGEYGPDMRVTLEEDDEIEPILTAARKANSEFERLTSAGKQPVFRGNRDVGMNLILHPSGSYTTSICYDPYNRSPIPESRRRGALLEKSRSVPTSRTDVKGPLRPEKIKLPGESPTRKAPDEPVGSLSDAFEQLKKTDASLVSSLDRRGLSFDRPWALGNPRTIVELGSGGQPLSKMTFHFPREEVKRGAGSASMMGNQTHIASMGSADFQKLATGITHTFLQRRSARTRVHDSAFRLICDTLAGPGKCVGDTYKGNIFDIFETIGSRGSTDLRVLQAFMLVVYYLIREAAPRGGRDAEYARPFYMQQYMKDAYDMNVGIHALAAWRADQAGEELPPGVLDVRPGSKKPGIFDRIGRAAKAKSLNRMIRALRDNDVLRTIGVAGTNISIIDGDDDEQAFDVTGPEEIDLVQRREKVTSALDSLIKDHIPDLKKGLVRATNYIKRRPVAPNTATSLGGNLPLMTFCMSVAEISNNAIAVQALKDMGCKHEGSLAFMENVTPLNVWNRWTQLSGEPNAMPSGGVDFSYSRTHEFNAWKNFALGAIAGKLAKHVSQLLHSQFVLPVIACLYVAIHEFRAQRLLTEAEFEKYYKSLSALANDVELEFNGASISLNAATVASKVTAAGSFAVRTGIRKIVEPASVYPQKSVGKVQPELSKVSLAEGAPFIIDIADKYIMPRDLPGSGAPTEPPPAAPPPSPTPTPAPAPAPAPTAEPAPAPAPAPPPPPAASARQIVYEEKGVGGETIKTSWNTSKLNGLTIEVQLGGFRASIVANAQGANSVNQQAVEQDSFSQLQIRSASVATAKSGDETLDIDNLDSLKQAINNNLTGPHPKTIERLADAVRSFLEGKQELIMLPGVTQVPDPTSPIRVTVSYRQSS